MPHTQLFTARFLNPTLAEHPAAKVRITVGAPRFSLPYNLRQVLELAPTRWMLDKPEAEFTDMYLRLLEMRGGVTKMQSRFAQVAEEAGVDQLVLLCFELLGEPGVFCHRRIFADYWTEATGEPVPELPEGQIAERLT